jgi:hypothetical protein
MEHDVGQPRRVQDTERHNRQPDDGGDTDDLFDPDGKAHGSPTE